MLASSILAVFIAFAIATDVSYPTILLQFAQTTVSKLMILTIILYLFARKKFIPGALMTVFAIQLFNEATRQYFIPNEKRKFNLMSSFNEIHQTLEEEIVHQMKRSI